MNITTWRTYILKRSLLKITLFTIITITLTSCANNKNHLIEVEGVDITYSEYFKTYDKLDMRKNLRFYKPFSIDTIVANLLEPLTKSINLLDTAKLPFEVDEEQAYLITSKDENGSIKHQLQLSYLSKTEYDDIGNFYIVSITEVDENPLKGHQILEKRDSIGNELKTYNLTNTLPIYQQIITTNSALLYKYYDYDIDNKKVVTVGTSANELYTYYNGAIYHIGYSINDEKANPEFHNEMLQLTREFILADTHHDM